MNKYTTALLDDSSTSSGDTIGIIIITGLVFWIVALLLIEYLFGD